MSSGSKILGFIGVLGVGGSSLAFVLFTGKEVPTVGLVAPVFAAAPERVELRALSRDETLGELLAGVLDANDQYSFILALERARQSSPPAAWYRSGFPLAHCRALRVAVSRYHSGRGLDRPVDALPRRVELAP